MLRTLFGFTKLNPLTTSINSSKSSNTFHLFDQSTCFPILQTDRGFKPRYKKPFKHWRDSIVKKTPHPRYREVLDPSLFNEEEPIRSSKKFGDIAEDRKPDREFAFDLQSLTSRGFLRFQKPYDPPADASERFLGVLIEIEPKLQHLSATQLMEYKLEDPLFKYNLLAKANQEFSHAVPNSLMYLIDTVGEAIKFYTTKVNTNTPYEELVRAKDLPENLHIQKDYVRLTEDSDFLGGVSAFPKSKTLVTGLYAKRIYGKKA